jgi:hypothetical protein
MCQNNYIFVNKSDTIRESPCINIFFNLQKVPICLYVSYKFEILYIFNDGL